MIKKPVFGKSSAPSQEVGVVIGVDGTTAKVRPQTSPVCESCGSASMCFPADGASPVVEANNMIGAVVGDVVSLEQPEGQRIGASLLVFGIPVATTIGGTIIGMNSAGGSPGGAASGAIAGLALGMLVIHFISRLVGAAKAMRPAVKEVLVHHEAPFVV